MTLQSFLVRSDPRQDQFTAAHQARTASRQVLYLALHLLPGALAYFFINVSAIHGFMVRVTHIPDPLLQGLYMVGVTLVWHLFFPLIVLNWAEKLSFRQIVSFLGLDHFDFKGFFLVVPLFFLVYTLLSLPFMRFAYPVLVDWINSVPWLRVPSYSIFQGTRIYLLPGWMLLLFAVGNFVGEEVYFRGYLLKKIGFLGSWAWVVNSMLFALYHMWQPAMTWPLIILSLAFGLLMRWRKNLYPLIFFHFLANIAWGAIIGAVLARWH
jgi:membrane protease YdiL (CAAX protease family)